MRQAQLKENLLKFCNAFRKNFPEITNEAICNSNLEDEISRIQMLSKEGYEYLDGVYHSGIDSFISFLHEEKLDNKNVCERCLALGYGMLTIYGLEIEEYQNWICASGNDLTPIFLGLVDGNLSSEDANRIRSFYQKITGQTIIATQKKNIDDFCGIKLIDRRSQNDYEYKVFEKYISYTKEFDDYDNAIGDLYEIIGIGTEILNEVYFGTLDKPHAYGANFTATLFELFGGCEEALQETLNAFARYFREKGICAEKIQSFRRDYGKTAGHIKELFLDFLTKITTCFAMSFPTKQAYSHEYIEHMIQTDHLRRILMSPNQTDGALGAAISVGNHMLTDILTTAFDSTADFITNTVREASFEKKMITLMQKVNNDEEDDSNICYAVFCELRYAIEDAFFEMIGVSNYCLDEEMADSNLMHDLMEHHFGNKNLQIGEPEIKTAVINSLIQKPFDSYPLAVLYTIYGDDAANYDGIVEYRGFDEEFHEHLAVCERYVVDIFRRLSTDTSADVAMSVKQIKDYLSSHQKFDDCLPELLKMYESFDFDFKLIEKAKARIEENKKTVNNFIATAQDKKLKDAAENGNGYAQFMLRLIYEKLGFRALEFSWVDQEREVSALAKYLYYAGRASHWHHKDIVNGTFTEGSTQLIESADQGIAAAATLAAYYYLEFEKDGFVKGKDYLKFALCHDDPRAYTIYSDYLRSGKYGFYINTALADLFSEVAHAYGMR